MLNSLKKALSASRFFLGHLSRFNSFSIALTALLFSAGNTAYATTTAGAIAGSFKVGESGGATYTIPIAVPPGTAGMTPNLSLAYSSQGGNSFVGMGWSLTGLSVIHRCPKTVPQDGVKGVIAYDSNDRFCLDGQRLIAISGTYGADLTEYRTENESFTRIISYSTAGSGPAYFKAWTKSGQIIEFGNTTDSRIEAQGKTSVSIWSANKITDTKGNYFTVSYTETNANGEYYPDRIDYTGNTAASLAPYNSVQFTYQSRTDITPQYHAGSLSKRTQRLTNIKTYSGTSLVKDYQLTYNYSAITQRSRLETITECAADGVCLPATTFSWQTGTAGWTTQSNFAPPTPISHWSGSTNANWGVITEDINGDGLPDFLQCETAGACNAWLNTGSGWQSHTGYTPPTPVSHWSGSINVDLGVRVVDVTGDGLPDWLQCETAGACNAWRNTGSGWQQDTAYVPPTPIAHWNGSTNAYWGVYIADVNGDARPDFLQCETAGSCNAWLNTGSGWQQNTGYAPPTPVSHWSGSVNVDWGVRLVDVNGDGLPDWLQCETAGACNAWLNTGSGWQQNTAYTPPTVVSHWSGSTNVDLGVQTVDVNGDGLTDWLHARPQVHAMRG